MGENRRITQVRTARSVICRIHLLDGKLFEIDVDVSSSALFSQVTIVTSIHWAHGQQTYSISFFFNFQKRAVGQILFDKVCEHLDLIEKDYFGLSFTGLHTGLRVGVRTV